MSISSLAIPGYGGLWHAAAASTAAVWGSTWKGVNGALVQRVGRSTPLHDSASITVSLVGGCLSHVGSGGLQGSGSGIGRGALFQ